MKLAMYTRELALWNSVFPSFNMDVVANCDKN